MPRKSILTVTCVAALAMACATMGGTGGAGPEPPFEWNAAYADSGTRLEVHELGRRPGSGTMGTLVRYRFVATGFTPGEDLELWRRIGGVFEPLPASVNTDGAVILAGFSETFTVGGFVPGEPLDVALVSQTSGLRAHAKTIPFPIEATSAEGCTLAVEVLAPSGLVFLITLRGFDVGSTVTTVSEFGDERFEQTDTVPPAGEVKHLVKFGSGSQGKATFEARDESCEVSLEYGVGPDAMVVQ
ncbi:MAG: hypothetical protein GWN99_08810 [Gemmatimonadetes bacterium]|uniref:Uncharacterized protein n=1 Tax=Candidatus Kutchimonas denitrificans TaxID=3056748 RepID=A0AAE4ZAH2_9BACT|nr:hypothetical protein [Gemmatimonadota bacterium]NIR76598.1 hypothetical protein [Candidatus Kutchimonas denitrificans]NIS01154.1 hypothetical protein [Gemmatimonadota bacterium]NIT66921.1 hypothetical protein [Gemmatimonadota bacterium]NIU54694.1 hypothetical protein [Gemmatimonadota bacterium]